MNSDRAMSTVSPASTTNDDIANGFQNLGISISNVNDLQITCFSDVFNDTTLHFQIIRLPKQVSCSISSYLCFYVLCPSISYTKSGTFTWLRDAILSSASSLYLPWPWSLSFSLILFKLYGFIGSLSISLTFKQLITQSSN